MSITGPAGWGEDATGLSFGHFLSQDYASLVTFDRIHSGPLDVAATQGLLGLAALGWVLVVLLQGAWQKRSAPDVGGLAAALAGYSAWVLFNFDWAPATGAFWLLAGALWSAVSAPPHSLGGGPKGRRGQAGRSIGAVGLVLAAIVFAVFPVLADVWYLKGRADLAVKVDPLQAQYHWALGGIEQLPRAWAGEPYAGARRLSARPRDRPVLQPCGTAPVGARRLATPRRRLPDTRRYGAPRGARRSSPVALRAA